MRVDELNFDTGQTNAIRELFVNFHFLEGGKGSRATWKFVCYLLLNHQQEIKEIMEED